jgi:hypothetical protein
VVTLSGHSILTGMLVAHQRTAKIIDHATVFGTVTANRVVLKNAGQIIQPPVVSP